MGIMLRQLAGCSLTDDELSQLIDKAFQQAGTSTGIDLAMFRSTLKTADISNMSVQVPVEL